MKCISAEECLTWVLGHLPPGSVPKVEFGKPQLPWLEFTNVEYQLPTDSGGKVNLARVASRRFEVETEVLVWVQNWEVWPSSGHMPLALRFREALGERRSMHERPGHCFSSGEIADVVSLIVMALEFYWDCLIVGESGRCAFYVSHDEYYAFMTRNADDAARFKADIGPG